MAIKFTREQISSNGAKESVTENFERESILIGRGADCDLRLAGGAVALRHARITATDQGFRLENIDSLSGTRINSKLVQSQVLVDADSLRIGDHLLRVNISGTDLILLEVVRENENISQSSAEQLNERARSLSISESMPPIRAVSLLAILVIVLLSAYYPSATGDKRIWESGKVTNHHRMVEHNCKSCHEGGFNLVADRKCLSCHALSDHAPAGHENIPGLSSRACVSCHREHDGEDALLPKQTKLCVECHTDIKKVATKSTLTNVESWTYHPEFAVTLPGSESKERVSLADSAKLLDNSHVKLNHSAHLRAGLRGANGPVSLQCQDCHRLSKDFKAIVPVKMEANCKSCHNLQFDEKISVEVPHADPDVVYKFIYAEYAKLLLAPAETAYEDSTRFRPGEEATAQNDQPAFVRNQVEKLSRAAEKELFSRTACKLCHDVADSGADAASQLSLYKVLKPEVPSTWMTAARFAHGAHEEVACISCHPEAPGSKLTSDVLVPKKEVCLQCHADNSAAGKVGSTCVMCHSFHDSLALPVAVKKEWKNGKLKQGNHERISERAL